MADTKVSGLTEVTTLTLTDLIYLVQSGNSRGMNKVNLQKELVWRPTNKTAAYTAVHGDEIRCDTATTSAFTVTLPITPVDGDRVRIIDSRANFASANLTIGRNGETIRGAASNLTISTNNQNYEFIYNGTDSDWEYLVYEIDTTMTGSTWTTVVKTANYTAVSNEEVLCDTATTSAFTVTLPASPSGGDRVRIIDSESNFASANLTVGRNGETIGDVAADLVISTDDQNYEFIFNGTTSDWEFIIFEVDTTGGGGDVDQIILRTGNGFGSTNTKIKRFTNVDENETSGGHLTLTQSATDGDKITANTTGVYAISYSDNASATNTSFGITINETEPTVNISSKTQEDEIVLFEIDVGSGVGFISSAVTLRLNATDVIMAHTNGVAENDAKHCHLIVVGPI